jgi:hypothetical protein
MYIDVLTVHACKVMRSEARAYQIGKFYESLATGQMARNGETRFCPGRKRRM